MRSISEDFRLFALSNTAASPTAVDKMIQSQNQVLAGYGSINPTIIEERKLNVAAMDVFSRLMMDRIIFLGTEIDDYTSNVIQAQLLYLNSQDKADISIYINSPGGVVYDGLGIYDTMQFVDCDVSTTCVGMAASMASILLCAGAKGKRAALPHSRIMIHQPIGGVRGQASDIEIEAKQILKLKDELYQIIADHSSRTRKQIEALISEQNDCRQ
jgi:ATP-dependent Clp protease protease subunit